MFRIGLAPTSPKQIILSFVCVLGNHIVVFGVSLHIQVCTQQSSAVLGSNMVYSHTRERRHEETRRKERRRKIKKDGKITELRGRKNEKTEIRRSWRGA